MKKVRQIDRTKRLIREAFMQLIEEKPYKKITVTDICARAGFARKTFYAHYETKQDIIAEQLNNFLEGSFYGPMSEIKKFPPRSEEEMKILKLIEMWKENMHFFQFLAENALNDFLVSKYVEMLDKIQTDLINPAMEIDPQKIPMDYFYIYMANAQIGILQHWVKNDIRISSEDLGRIMRSLTGPLTLKHFVNEFETRPIKS
jgi:AcrR family transcriptional regulator